MRGRLQNTHRGPADFTQPCVGPPLIFISLGMFDFAKYERG